MVNFPKLGKLKGDAQNVTFQENYRKFGDNMNACRRLETMQKSGIDKTGRTYQLCKNVKQISVNVVCYSLNLK